MQYLHHFFHIHLNCLNCIHICLQYQCFYTLNPLLFLFHILVNSFLLNLVPLFLIHQQKWMLLHSKNKDKYFRHYRFLFFLCRRQYKNVPPAICFKISLLLFIIASTNPTITSRTFPITYLLTYYHSILFCQPLLNNI